MHDITISGSTEECDFLDTYYVFERVEWATHIIIKKFLSKIRKARSKNAKHNEHM